MGHGACRGNRASGGDHMALASRNYGSRQAGTGAWLLVRITAVIIAAGLLMLVVLMTHMRGMDYRAWHGIFSDLPVRLLFASWLCAVVLHVYLGCDTILKDYVQTPGLRLASMIMVAGLLLSLMLYGFVVLFP